MLSNMFVLREPLMVWTKRNQCEHHKTDSCVCELTDSARFKGLVKAQWLKIQTIQHSKEQAKFYICMLKRKKKRKKNKSYSSYWLCESNIKDKWSLT